MFPNMLFGNQRYFRESDYEDSPEHVEMKERLRKTLYYGKMPTMDRPSLAMTELAVEMFQDLAPKGLGRVDLDWASAVSREALMSPGSVLMGMVYAKRLKKRNSSYLNQLSSSELFLVSVMMASKLLCDEGEIEDVLNEEWAESANMDVDEINELERNFLAAMDWQLFVKPGEFWAAMLALEQEIAWRKAKQRGNSFTYTDLTVLADRHQCQAFLVLLQEACKVVVVCTLAYFACVLGIAAAKPVHDYTVSALLVIPASLSRPIIDESHSLSCNTSAASNGESVEVKVIAEQPPEISSLPIESPSAMVAVYTVFKEVMLRLILSAVSREPVHHSGIVGLESSCHLCRHCHNISASLAGVPHMLESWKKPETRSCLANVIAPTSPGLSGATHSLINKCVRNDVGSAVKKAKESQQSHGPELSAGAAYESGVGHLAQADDNLVPPLVASHNWSQMMEVFSSHGQLVEVY